MSFTLEFVCNECAKVCLLFGALLKTSVVVSACFPIYRSSESRAH